MKWREAESTQYCNKNTLGVPMFTTLLLSALVSTANISQNETYNVISHQDYRAETSSQNAVWRIFTDRKRVFHDGVRIQPVISSDDAIHRAFCENSLGMTPHQFRTYWLKKRFTSPARLPLQSPSDSVTRKGVRDRSNWIGVVAASSSNYRLRHLNRPMRLRSQL